MSTGSAPRGGHNWFAILALVLVCTILGSLGGTLAGGAAGYFLGRHAMQHEVSQAAPPPAEAAPGARPRQIIPPLGGDEPWPGQMPLPGVSVWAEVASVVTGAPAEKAGIKAGDQITAVDGRALTLRRDLAQAIGSYRPGDEVELTLARDGAELQVRATLGENPDKAGAPYLGLTYSMAAGAASRFPSS